MRKHTKSCLHRVLISPFDADRITYDNLQNTMSGPTLFSMLLRRYTLSSVLLLTFTLRVTLTPLLAMITRGWTFANGVGLGICDYCIYEGCVSQTPSEYVNIKIKLNMINSK